MQSDTLLFNYSNSFAIVIGINKYLHLGPLSGAVNDATAFAEVLFKRVKIPTRSYLSYDK